MRTKQLVAAFWTVLGIAAAQPVVTVRVYNYAGVSESLVEKAKLEGRRILLDAGLAVKWLECPLADGRSGPRYDECLASTSAVDIILRIVPRAMERERNLGRSLGYSLPFVGRPAVQAYVLYDRVREKLRKCEGVSEFRLLGCVMAHEIAHLLFGDDGHSRQGVMMAFWRETELAEIGRGAMRFTSDEAGRLRAGAVARAAAGGETTGTALENSRVAAAAELKDPRK